MTYATFNGATIVDALITIPYYGNWIADITVDTPPRSSSSVTVVLADLTLIGTVARDGEYAGKYRARVVGGRNGWHSTIPALSYRHDAGVKMSTVLGDAARAVSETILIQTDNIIGPAFVRQEGPASRVLNHLAGDVWYMRSDGITYVGARASSKITDKFDVTAYDGAAGRAEIASEAVAAFVPGRTLSASNLAERTIGGVVHMLQGFKLRTHLMVTP